MISMALAGAMLAALSIQTSASQADCTADTERYLTQSADEFDQSDTGWRELADRRCYIEAADAIAAYRLGNEARVDGNVMQMLNWHEGQMFAYAREYERALERFRLTFPQTDRYPDQTLKTQAVIAFLERDREALLAVRESLASLPEPEYFQRAIARIRERDPAARLPAWPPALEEVDRYLACFEDDYAIAYEGLCEAARN